MTRTIDVVFRYQEAEVEHYGAVAVIDTLRATTTMTAILERGALAVRPVAGLEEAYALKERDPHLLLGGERDNRPPDGFDGGNSPYDWPESRVHGQRVVFSTTNGTAAIDKVRSIPRLVLAALTNADAASRYLWQLERPTLVVASGTRGRVSLEDVLAAGALVSLWPRESRSDAADMAATVFSAHRDRLREAVREARHGRDLWDMGLEKDLDFAAGLNTSAIVPVLCQDGWIRAAD
ncbi:MAG: 2-phosphosulfolactate phosphatase [Firmicutes bacterium]|nr:2-phosphosulfolactate phosphatase [Bacillota bacterium]